MRINLYSVKLNDDKAPVLVKERGFNYAADATNTNSAIVQMLCDIVQIDRLPEEHVYLIPMNAKVKPLGLFEISHGIINNSFVSSREVFMRLLLCNAASFVIVHNHPSGDCSPSGADIDVTRQLLEASKLMNVVFLDHIIIGDSYCSLRERGDLAWVR